MKDLGLAYKILGIQIYWDKKDTKVWHSQKELLTKSFAMLQHARL